MELSLSRLREHKWKIPVLNGRVYGGHVSVPTVADAILDRVIHNAYRIELSGDSLRKRRSKTDKTERA
jgi:DNA replication protein DnaC